MKDRTLSMVPSFAGLGDARIFLLQICDLGNRVCFHLTNVGSII